MRYSKSESTYILGNFSSGDTVTIDIYRISDGTKVVNGSSCSEIGTTGVFKYNFSQTITSKTEYLWIMDNSDEEQKGKIVLGGYMDDIQADLDNPSQYKADVSNLALESTAQAIKTQTDKMNFTGDDIKATLDGETVNLSSTTETQIDNIETNTDNIKLQTNKMNFVGDDIKATLDGETVNLSSTTETQIDNIEIQTNKMNFVGDDIKATLDGEEVNLTSDTETQIDNIENDLNNPSQFKADVSDLALETTVQAIKSQTDNFEFVGTDVKATLDGETVNLSSTTETQIDSIETNTNNIKLQTDKMNFTGDDIKATLDGETVNLSSTTETQIDNIETNTNSIKSQTDTINWDDIEKILKINKNKIKIEGNQLIIYDDDGTTELYKFNLKDIDGNPTNKNITERDPI